MSSACARVRGPALSPYRSYQHASRRGKEAEAAARGVVKKTGSPASSLWESKVRKEGSLGLMEDAISQSSAFNATRGFFQTYNSGEIASSTSSEDEETSQNTSNNYVATMLMQWPPPSLGRAKSRIRRESSGCGFGGSTAGSKGVNNSLLLVRQKAALLEAKQFAHELELLIARLNRFSRREDTVEFEEEFLRIEITALPGHYHRSWFSVALEKRNIALNRYINVMAMDKTRVKLLDVDEGESDYVNASFIQGVPTEISYIAAQNPLPSTMGHFWQMVWEQNISVIVMLTKLVEKGKVKGEQYWPDIGESILYGTSYRVIAEGHTAKSKETYLQIRTFILWKAPPGSEDDLDRTRREGRHITHVQYMSWPDHGIPKTCKPLLNLLAMVDELICPEDEDDFDAVPVDDDGTGLDNEREPCVLVHCSAGIGRTGTYIAVDIALRQYYALHNKSPAESEKLKRLGIEPMTVHGLEGIVRSLKQQRFGMVQTWQQYRFAYIAVLYGIQLLLTKEEKEIEVLTQSSVRTVRRKKISHFGQHGSEDTDGSEWDQGEEEKSLMDARANMLTSQKLAEVLIRFEELSTPRGRDTGRHSSRDMGS
ncbi:Tyrosine-protein phosphatase non-receptor type 1 [Porphyridium purpureum]|uniref:Tyrosine-protein phosphatase non-receptor type 1 n=1 Tax=Porphyridium purpureum TaxID=35688 RepID=A0A5J4YXM6_PORPP|nr:Tyrosine-protein phosphatase non-receptor type 1 [Porphyridium purpureum]|eukprot:POR0492..scf209_3